MTDGGPPRPSSSFARSTDQTDGRTPLPSLPLVQSLARQSPVMDDQQNLAPFPPSSFPPPSLFPRSTKRSGLTHSSAFHSGSLSCLPPAGIMRRRRRQSGGLLAAAAIGLGVGGNVCPSVGPSVRPWEREREREREVETGEAKRKSFSIAIRKTTMKATTTSMIGYDDYFNARTLD